MNEPTPEQNKNLDEMTRLTLRVIQLETDMVKAAQILSENSELSEVRDKQLDNRIAILEEARKRQITLNDSFVQKSVLPIEKPIKRFKWF